MGMQLKCSISTQAKIGKSPKDAPAPLTKMIYEPADI